jgi:hypothetical protein
MPRRPTALSLVALLALAVGHSATPAVATAEAPQAKRLTAAQKHTLRKRLQRELRRAPAALRRRSFLRRAALVDFQLPVTIRLRNPCMSASGMNPAPGFGQNCTTQGTALNQRIVPTARVNLGPSLGTRELAISGALSAVVEFQDTYDGGALGNVNIKLLPGDKTLRTSSVPLLWNEDIADPATRSDANWLASQARPGGALAALQSYADGSSNRQGCGDWTTSAGEGGSSAAAPAGPGYKALFHGAPADFGAGTGNGLPGYPVVTAGGSPSGVFLPIRPGVDAPQNIQTGALTGNNDWVGPGTDPFPAGSAPAGLDSSAVNTVLRTAALSIGIAPGGVAVNMSTGTATAPGGLTTAQGSQDTTLGYSGGQANLFGNIPGKSVGVDVTVNLATKINAIARVLDQDVYKQPGVVEGERLPAAYFQCRQVFTGAVQNYIPGVRLTGSLRIAPAIMKDGRVRIAKATVQSPLSRGTRVALSACLFPAKPFNAYAPGYNDWTAPPAPSPAQVTAGGSQQPVAGGTLAVDGNASLPFVDAQRYPNLAEGMSPTSVPCGSDAPGELAEVIRSGGLTQTVSGLPAPTDPAFAGVAYRGDQATVAGDIVVDPIEVDVLIGDEPIGD